MHGSIHTDPWGHGSIIYVTVCVCITISRFRIAREIDKSEQSYEVIAIIHNKALFSHNCVKKTHKMNGSNGHYSNVIKSAIVSQIIGVSIVCPTVCSGADQKTRQSSASLAFVRGIHRSPVDSPHKWPVTRKMFPFVDVIMISDCK